MNLGIETMTEIEDFIKQLYREGYSILGEFPMNEKAALKLAETMKNKQKETKYPQKGG